MLRESPDRQNTQPQGNHSTVTEPVHSTPTQTKGPKSRGPKLNADDRLSQLPTDIIHELIRHLDTADIARLSRTNRTFRNAYGHDGDLPGLATIRLASEVAGPPQVDSSREDKPRDPDLSATTNVGHLNTGKTKTAPGNAGNDRRSRLMLEQLMRHGLIATRALNQADRDNIVKGMPIQSTGAGTSTQDIESHVDLSRDTALFRRHRSSLIDIPEDLRAT
jgi:F-box domain